MPQFVGSDKGQSLVSSALCSGTSSIPMEDVLGVDK